MDIDSYFKENHQFIRHFLQSLSEAGEQIEFEQQFHKRRVRPLLSFAELFINTIHIQREKLLLDMITKGDKDQLTHALTVGLIINQGKASNGLTQLQTKIDNWEDQQDKKELYNIAGELRQYILSTLKHLHDTEQLLTTKRFRQLTREQYETLQQQLQRIEGHYADSLPHLPPEIEQLTNNSVVQQLNPTHQ